MSSRYVETLLRAVSSNKLDLQGVLSNLTSATAAASAAPLDHFYARIGALNGPFFPAGWGNLSVVNYEEDLRHLIQGPPSSIKLAWRLIERGSRDGTDYLLYEGTFRTPCLQRVFDALPPESRTGRVQLLMPAHLQSFRPDLDTASSQQQVPDRLLGYDLPASAATQPSFTAGQSARRQHQHPAAADSPACVVHLAATGDQTFGRRLRLGFPLLKDNVCSMVLESPFYGARRPAAQRGSKLLRVSDLLTLGWATIAESVNLLHWLREEGYGALGMCGFSMGGVHACMTAGLYPDDVAVAPLLAPRSAAVAYCDGAMRAVMAWEPLLKEVDENNNHIAQVVMAAGRAVTVQVPGPVQSVALMREATYALADLEARGEKRHLAAGSPPTGAGLLPVRSASGGADADGEGAKEARSEARGDGAAIGLSGGAVAEAAAGAGGAGSGSGSRIGGVGAVLRGLPFISVMDLYGSLAGAALRAGGADDGSTDPRVARQPQHPAAPDGSLQTPTAEAPTAKADLSRRSADEDAGPFSGIIGGTAKQQQQPGGAAHHDQERHRTWRPHSAAPHGDGQGSRTHPPPHSPDMPILPQQSAPRTGGSSAGDGSGSGGGGGAVMGRRLLGELGRAVKELRADDRRLDNPDTVMRLKRVLETYTDITRYPRPRRADAAVIVAARDDAYVSTESVQQLHRYWPESELRMVSGGHVSAFLMHQEAFRGAIRDSLARVARPPPGTTRGQ